MNLFDYNNNPAEQIPAQPEAAVSPVLSPRAVFENLKSMVPTLKRVFWLEENSSFQSRYEKAVQNVCKAKSAHVLDGRDKIVGGSEVSVRCERRIVLTKRHGEPEHSFDTLTNFYRGHRMEEFNAPVHRQISFEDGVYWLPQMILTDPDHPISRVTVDNIYYVSPTGRIEDALSICVVQEKNTSEVKADPYEEYIDQVHYELAVVQACFPNAHVYEFLYATDLNGQHTDYGVRFEFDPQRRNELYARARRIMKHLADGTTPRSRPSHLCGFCGFQEECPSWKAAEVPADIQQMAKRYKEINDLKAALDNEQDVIKKHLKAALTSPEKPYFRGQIAAGVYVSVSDQDGRESCDIKGLKKGHPQIAAKYVKRGNSYQVMRIDIKPVSAPAVDEQAESDALASSQVS